MFSFYNLLCVVLTGLLLLVSVAFFTLLERKVLRATQIRVGPNKVLLAGLGQPFADAIKLFSNALIIPSSRTMLAYFITPRIAIVLGLSLWLASPSISIVNMWNFGLLWVLIISTIGTYPVLIAGWGSHSLYALLGSLRASAQSISYEISLIFLFLVVMVLSQGFTTCITSSILVVGLVSSFLLFFITAVSETHRAPFDFAEGESELVRGFNVEYSRGGFGIFFLAEMINIIFFGVIIGVIFIRFNILTFIVIFILYSYMVLGIRTRYPRLRYDILIRSFWWRILPLSLSFVSFCIL